MSTNAQLNDNSLETVVLTREYIMKSKINSISVSNSKEDYEKYFKLGGTVAKMNFASTKKYSDFVKKRSLKDDNN
jgi:hypothetical protein